MDQNTTFSRITFEEARSINGGTTAVDSTLLYPSNISYYTFLVGKKIFEWGKIASEFQASLPPNLKK